MSTGNQPDGPDLYFASGDNQTRRDVQQFDEGFSGIQADAYNIGPNETANFRFRQDSQGFPVINNYGTMNVVIEGNGGQRQRGWAGDGGVDWGYEQFCKDKAARRYDFQSDRWDANVTQMRPSDMRRQALIDDGRALDDMYRGEMERANYSRYYGDRMYGHPGQHTSYSRGDQRGLTYYESGPSLYNRDLPWYVNDCFGQGGRYGNGDMQAFRGILRDVLPAIVAMKHADDYGGGGYWDRRHDRSYSGMGYMERMIMDRALGNNQWNRYSPRMYNPNQSFDYASGTRDGLTYMNQGPSYAHWNGPRTGMQDFADNVMPIFRDVAPFIVAMKYADNDNNNYRSYNGGDNYYHERNQSMRMAYNREEAQARRERQAERIRRNREDAMRRREYS